MILSPEAKSDFRKFALTFLVGGCITFSWQHLEHEFERKEEQRKYEKTQATGVFEDESKLLGKVIINFQLLAEGRKTNSEWPQAYFDWKENATKDRALIEEYYGKETSDSLNEIDDLINTIYDKFSDQNPSKASAESELQTEVNGLDNKIFQLNSVLIELLLNGKIGSNK